jgi:dTDP-D-glucose 4,6-dehydratase
MMPSRAFPLFQEREYMAESQELQKAFFRLCCLNTDEVYGMYC